LVRHLKDRKKRAPPPIKERLRRLGKQFNEAAKIFVTAVGEHTQDQRWVRNAQRNEYIPRSVLRYELERRRRPWLQEREGAPDRSWIPDWLLEEILE